MNWLDTETKAILRKEPVSKLAPSKAGEFALVLLMKGLDQDRLVRAISRVNECGKEEATLLALQPVPATINPGLSEAAAIYGQFELICCDSVSAFIRGEVWQEQTNSSYMNAILLKVFRSPEFAPTRLKVLEVPATETGQEFADQFLTATLSGPGRRTLPATLNVPFKKARIMKLWAERIGAKISCEALDGSKDGRELT